MAHRGTTVPWQRIVTIYVLVQFAEIFGVAMIYAYLPLALEGAGVPLRDIATLSGATTAGIFIVGAPQVPIWLAIAELRSRRLVIVRSGLIALVALIAFAFAQEAWQLIGATLALGFWLGNTGVMLATIREVSPEHARTRSIALFSAAAPMGFALGPLLAGAMIDGLGLSLAAPIMVAALLNAALIVANIVAIPDVRPHHPPTGGVLEVARRGLREVFADRRIRAGYLVLGLAIAGERMLRPVFPLRIAEVVIGPSITGIAEPLAAPGVAGAVGGTVTKGGLIFATGGGSVLYALDTRDGSVKWQFELPAGRGYANPISYRGANGVQYIVLATGGGDNAELIAFSLDGTH